jgi:hypothetical protein
LQEAARESILGALLLEPRPASFQYLRPASAAATIASVSDAVPIVLFLQRRRKVVAADGERAVAEASRRQTRLRGVNGFRKGGDRARDILARRKRGRAVANARTWSSGESAFKVSGEPLA